MKTKIFLLGAIGLLAMASCSNDELVGVNHDGDEIAFNVVTNASSRANTESGGVYCNNNMPKTFYVWAKTTGTNGQTYIEGDEITQENGSWINNSGTRFWPEGTVDFYASVNAKSDNANYKFNWNGSNAPTIAVNVPTTVTDQKDLLYAVKKGQNKDTNNRVVNLNFRHALSQVVFTAQNVNPNLHVEITGVSVCNVKSQGTFTYPTADTDANIDGHPTTPGTLAEPNYDTSWGTWETPSVPQNYPVTFDAVTIPGNKDQTTASTSLTNTNVDSKEYSENAMLLLPQTSTPWDRTAKAKEQTTGTYFLVKCLIYNIAGTTFDSASDVCLWGTEKNGTYEAKEVAIPVALNWEQGKKYIYNFVFGNENGGFDPEIPENPVLIPIKFDLSVDEFVPMSVITTPETSL